MKNVKRRTLNAERKDEYDNENEHDNVEEAGATPIRPNADPFPLNAERMNNILEMRGITKTFPGVKALDNVNLSVRQGDIHALVGENGAGKSTLMKVLSGVYPHGTYSGEIHYQGQERHLEGISDSEKLGIIIIHQELALVPLLSITENIFLGNEQAKNGVIDWDAAEKRTHGASPESGFE